MILEIIKHPDEMLNKKSLEVKRINKELVQLGKDLLETMKEHLALGLSAVQTGQLVRVLVMMQGKKPLLMYNPIIASQSHTKRASKEKCLSFQKDEEYIVKRFLDVKVKYTDINNKQKFVYLDGLDSVVFQHELSHLNGLTMELEGIEVEKE